MRNAWGCSFFWLLVRLLKFFSRQPDALFVRGLGDRANWVRAWPVCLLGSTMAGDFALNDTNTTGVIVFGLLMGT